MFEGKAIIWNAGVGEIQLAGNLCSLIDRIEGNKSQKIEEANINFKQAV